MELDDSRLEMFVQRLPAVFYTVYSVRIREYEEKVCELRNVVTLVFSDRVPTEVVSPCDGTSHETVLECVDLFAYELQHYLLHSCLLPHPHRLHLFPHATHPGISPFRTRCLLYADRIGPSQTHFHFFHDSLGHQFRHFPVLFPSVIGSSSANAFSREKHKGCIRIFFLSLCFLLFRGRYLLCSTSQLVCRT